MWQQWLNLIVGLWIILSSYLNFTPSGMVTNFTISGIVVAVLATWGALEHKRMMEDEHMHSHA